VRRSEGESAEVGSGNAEVGRKGKGHGAEGIAHIPDKNKVILLTTGRLDSWKPDSSEIDAMSAASDMSETTPLARSISDKVLEIIGSPDNP